MPEIYELPIDKGEIMGVYGANSELGKLISNDSFIFDKIYNSIKFYAIANRASLEFLPDDYKNAYVKIDDDFNFKYALNLTAVEDMVEFDAVIEAGFSYQTKCCGDFKDNYGTQWFGMHCKMRVTDKIEEFYISNLEIYTSIRKQQLNNAVTMNFIPVIGKSDLENEAESFLQKWCPEALRTPMPVPIRKIVEEKMGLPIIIDKTLSKDLSVFGQICFADGMIKTFDKASGEYENTQVKRGTIMVDPDTVFLRCLGCGYNTLAHEAYHWEKHRIYATVHSILSKQQIVCHRCPIAPKGNIIRETMSSDEDWMEWQANAVAPKILMPKEQTGMKINSLIGKYQYIPYENGSEEIIKNIICELSDFYKVSKQAAKIRMIELGFPEANDVFNYDNDCIFISPEISQVDSFELYNTNNDFKVLFELGLFRNVDGYYVIDNEIYRARNETGNYALTDYAKDNLNQCTLQFTYNITDIFEFNKKNGVLYRGRKARPPEEIFLPKYNEETINKALAEVGNFRAQYEADLNFDGETSAQILMRLMNAKGWRSSTFQQKTGVNQSTYRKIKNSPKQNLELNILVSICVGLELSQETSKKIIEKAHISLNSNDLIYKAYSYILSPAMPKDITACNAFIEKINQDSKSAKIPLLGSGFYRENTGTNEE